MSKSSERSLEHLLRPTIPTPDASVKTKVAADRLSVGIDTIRRMIARGDLVGRKVRGTNQWRVSVASLDALLKEK